MYRDDDFVLDNFSQLLNQTQEYDDSTTTTTTIQIQEENELPKHQGKKSAKKKAADTINLQRLLEEFEEAFSALKSIQAAHSPISHTAMVAFLHQIRGGSKVNKRTVDGFLWPEHGQSLADSRLLSKPFTSIKKVNTSPSHKKIPKFEILDNIDESESSGPSAELSLCKFRQSDELHSALKLTAQSIWEKLKALNPSSHSSTILDPQMKHIVARHTARLLQAVFNRAVSTRKAAVMALRSKVSLPQGDVENVPINWESIQESAKQLIGNEIGLDQETFLQFNQRLEATFVNFKL